VFFALLATFAQGPGVAFAHERPRRGTPTSAAASRRLYRLVLKKALVAAATQPVMAAAVRALREWASEAPLTTITVVAETGRRWKLAVSKRYLKQVRVGTPKIAATTSKVSLQDSETTSHREVQACHDGWTTVVEQWVKQWAERGRWTTHESYAVAAHRIDPEGHGPPPMPLPELVWPPGSRPRTTMVHHELGRSRFFIGPDTYATELTHSQSYSATVTLPKGHPPVRVTEQRSWWKALTSSVAQALVSEDDDPRHRLYGALSCLLASCDGYPARWGIAQQLAYLPAFAEPDHASYLLKAVPDDAPPPWGWQLSREPQYLGGRPIGDRITLALTRRDDPGVQLSLSMVPLDSERRHRQGTLARLEPALIIRQSYPEGGARLPGSPPPQRRWEVTVTIGPLGDSTSTRVLSTGASRFHLWHETERFWLDPEGRTLHRCRTRITQERYTVWPASP
jgi:hypothetical protein